MTQPKSSASFVINAMPGFARKIKQLGAEGELRRLGS